MNQTIRVIRFDECTRAAIIARLAAVIDPHLEIDGYRTSTAPKGDILDTSQSLRLWMPRDATGELTRETISFPGQKLVEICGLTELGPIDFILGESLSFIPYTALPDGDIALLLDWALTRFASTCTGTPA